MTTTTPFDNVIEHATETTKVASDRAREFAQIGVRKATEGFEQISKAAQTATEELNSQMTQAREGATKAGLTTTAGSKSDLAKAYLTKLTETESLSSVKAELGKILRDQYHVNPNTDCITCHR